MTDPDALYTTVWPEYFETQRKDLWYYERLWTVMLKQLEKRLVGRTLVEFGSGPGYLLKLAKERGWRTCGVEPSKVARDYSASIGVVGVYKEPCGLACASAVIATEVLEHIADPISTLQQWAQALAPGGHLAISVPNDNNPLQRIFGALLAPRVGESGGLIQCADRHRPWLHHTHLQYFNRRSLSRAVHLAGLDVVWERTSFPVELMLVLPIPRKWAWKLSRIWPAPPLLWRLGIGRHLLIIARKAP